MSSESPAPWEPGIQMTGAQLLGLINPTTMRFLLPNRGHLNGTLRYESNPVDIMSTRTHTKNKRRCAGLVVERRTPEREVGGSILTQVAVLYP